MSVIAFYGDGGSGKGYSQFELLIKAVKSGIPVVTTIEPTPEFYSQYPDADLEFIKPQTIYNEKGDLVELKSIVDFSEPKRGAFYILQEIHKIYDKTTMLQPFAVGFYMNKLPSHINIFFSERRHFVDVETGRSIQISFDTQSPLFVAKWLKAHIETAIHCEKHLEMGTTGLFSRLTYARGSAKSDKPVKSDLINRKLAIPYKKSVYSLYKSHGYAKGQINKLDEGRVGNHNSLLRSKMFWFTAVALFYLIYLFVKEPLIPISTEPLHKPVLSKTPPSPSASVQKFEQSKIEAVQKKFDDVTASLSSDHVLVDYSKLKVMKDGGGFIVDNFPANSKFLGSIIKDKKQYFVAQLDAALFYLPKDLEK